MKLSPIFGIIVLLFREAVVVGAADCVNLALSVIPSCAQNCFLNGAPSVGCAGVDFNCQCEQEARLYAIAEDCVSTACPSASYQAVIDGGSSVCSCATGGSGGDIVGSMSGLGTVVPETTPAPNIATTTTGLYYTPPFTTTVHYGATASVVSKAVYSATPNIRLGYILAFSVFLSC